jgi:N-acylneuraminate cytidylyltransferase/CMP-N,N'-diacetyllegionaminic acid synthase
MFQGGDKGVLGDMSEKPSKLLVIIPARKGSKGLKGKNYYPILDKPMIYYTFEALEGARPCDVLVSSDDPRIEAEAAHFKLPFERRPALLADHKTHLNSVMRYIYNQRSMYKAYMCLPPTSPLRTATHVKGALAEFYASKADSLISVREEHHSIWRFNGGYARPLVEIRRNRQDVMPVGVGNGSIFICKNSVLRYTGMKTAGRTKTFTMGPVSSLDIHGIEDIELAEFYLKKRAQHAEDKGSYYWR